MPKAIPADTWNNLFYPPRDYKYFENAAQFDFEANPHGFSWKNSWWLAESALLAYEKDWNKTTTVLTQAGFNADIRQIGSESAISTKGVFAFRSTPSPFAEMAFRGTDKDDPRNAKSDANTLPLSRNGYIVHTGFWEALDQVWKQEVEPLLAAFLQSHAGAAIYFTGHSLGAALATIAVARCSVPNCALYTIGSPRVGDDRFARLVLQKTQRVFRFVNCQDVVTQVPPEVPLTHYFRHVGKELYFDRKGALHEQPSELFKSADVVRGIVAHDGEGILEEIMHPREFLERYKNTVPLVDPPPFIIGNHTPARYSVRIWNYYTGA
ncbi:MAG TPA: lipase family protein [Candidatus Angelobacter sp.]